jgi:hypothetical protein
MFQTICACKPSSLTVSRYAKANTIPHCYGLFGVCVCVGVGVGGWVCGFLAPMHVGMQYALQS